MSEGYEAASVTHYRIQTKGINEMKAMRFAGENSI
jgi:hypothetical protein